MIVRLGVRLDGLPRDIPSLLAPLVDVLLEVRRRLRSAKQWELADLIRDGLDRAGIIVEDTEQGPKWHMQEKG
jgi:cysteinyl-tRNA synthetase